MHVMNIVTTIHEVYCFSQACRKLESQQQSEVNPEKEHKMTDSMEIFSLPSAYSGNGFKL